MTMRYAAVVVMTGALVACGTAPKERFYALSMPQANAVPSQSGVAVAVGPVTVPEMVDRPQLVVRVSENRVELSELNRWAEPLKRALPRAIAANIAQALPSSRVIVAGTDSVDPKACQVLVSVDRFDSELGKGAVMEASWSVRAGDEVRTGRSVLRESASGPGYEELVAAHSSAVAALGREIASAVSSLKR